ncbi:MAG: hypothetical protein ABI480_11395 [Chitinophagaceae bacterium]
MGKVTLKPLQHRDQECIGIYVEANEKIDKVLSKKAGAKWSRTNRCWYIPLNRQNYGLLQEALTELLI